MSSGDDLLERLLDWPYQGETMAHEAADRIRTLQAALMDWDALIEHQYSGSREAMSAMTEAAQRTARVLKGESSGDDLVERLRGIIVQVSAERDRLKASNLRLSGALYDLTSERDRLQAQVRFLERKAVESAKKA